MGGTGDPPVFGGNLPPQSPAGWSPAGTGRGPVPPRLDFPCRLQAGRTGRDSTSRPGPRFGPRNRGGAPVSKRLGPCGRARPVGNRRSGSGVESTACVVPRLMSPDGGAACCQFGTGSTFLGGEAHAPQPPFSSRARPSCAPAAALPKISENNLHHPEQFLFVRSGMNPCDDQRCRRIAQINPSTPALTPATSWLASPAWMTDLP